MKGLGVGRDSAGRRQIWKSFKVVGRFGARLHRGCLGKRNRKMGVWGNEDSRKGEAGSTEPDP